MPKNNPSENPVPVQKSNKMGGWVFGILSGTGILAEVLSGFPDRSPSRIFSDFLVLSIFLASVYNIKRKPESIN